MPAKCHTFNVWFKSMPGGVPEKMSNTYVRNKIKELWTYQKNRAEIMSNKKSNQVTRNARRRAQCKGGGGKEKYIYAKNGKNCTTDRHLPENVEEIIAWNKHPGNTKAERPIGPHLSQQFPTRYVRQNEKNGASQLRALILHGPTSSSTSTSTSTSTSFFNHHYHYHYPRNTYKPWTFILGNAADSLWPSTEHWLDTRMAWNLGRLERTNCTFCSRRKDWELVWYLSWFV